MSCVISTIRHDIPLVLVKTGAAGPFIEVGSFPAANDVSFPGWGKCPSLVLSWHLGFKLATFAGSREMSSDNEFLTSLHL